MLYSKNILLFLFYTIFICIPVLYSQKKDNTELEQLLENISRNTQSSQEIEEIEFLTLFPINLKIATHSVLMELPNFPYITAEKLLFYVQEKNINSYEELYKNIYLSPEQKYLLELTTYFGNIYEKRKKKNNIIYRARTQPLLNEIYGFEKNKFLGDDLDFYQRINGFYDDYSIGLITNKNCGEVNLNEFVSGYLSASFNDLAVVLGDYYIESGMGSLFWKSFGARKGADVISPVIRKSSCIKPNQSTMDNSFFRGIAVSYKFKTDTYSAIDFSAWYSGIHRSGSYDSITNTITSIKSDGYYRTNTEISKKNAVFENIYGASVEFNKPKLSVGINSYYILNSIPIYSESKSVFYGREGLLSSMYSLYSMQDKTFECEIARDANGNMAYNFGLQIIKNKYELAFAFRSFAAEFRSPFAYSFAESQSPANELGLYSGFKYIGIQKFIFSYYLDIYKTYTSTYQVSDIVKGIDCFYEVEWNLYKNTFAIFRIHYENKTDKIKDNNKNDNIVQKSNYLIRFDLRHNATSNINLRFRYESTIVNFQNQLAQEYGNAAFAEISWQVFDFIKLGSRVSYFDTDSYSSAIWQYEYSVPGYMTTTALYGQGSRFIIFCKLNILSSIDFWARYAVTSKNNVETLSSGLTEINANTDKKIILQLDIIF